MNRKLLFSVVFIVTLSVHYVMANESSNSRQVNTKAAELIKSFTETLRPQSVPAGQSRKQINDKYLKMKPQQDHIKAEIKKIGDSAIPSILREMKKRRRVEYLDLLSAIDSTKSQEELLRIANEGLSVYQCAAAEAFLKTVKSKREATKLFNSTNENVKRQAILSLRGVKLDEQLLDNLLEQLYVDNGNCAGIAAFVLRQDKTQAFVEKKVTILVKLILKLPPIEKGVILNGQVPASNKQITSRQYNLYTSMLIEIAGSEAILNEMAADKTKNLQLYWATVLVRANRGDISVRKEILDIIKATEGYSFRRYAVEALEYVGMPEDESLLFSILESDPYHYERRVSKFVNGGYSSNWTETFYPIRVAAKKVLSLKFGYDENKQYADRKSIKVVLESDPDFWEDGQGQWVLTYKKNRRSIQHSVPAVKRRQEIVIDSVGSLGGELLVQWIPSESSFIKWDIPYFAYKKRISKHVVYISQKADSYFKPMSQLQIDIIFKDLKKIKKYDFVHLRYDKDSELALYSFDVSTGIVEEDKVWRVSVGVMPMNFHVFALGKKNGQQEIYLGVIEVNRNKSNGSEFEIKWPEEGKQ